MAFAKYAYANIIKPDINIPVWDRVRDSAHALGSAFATREASKISLTEFSPKEYMLSHATIVASVDTDQGPGVLGRQLENGFTIERPYADYYVTPKSARFINNNCFVPGTSILMGDGTEKPIEAVQVGDVVVTHTGSIKRVTETFCHPFRGKLRRIRRLGDKRTLDVTAEHPFWALRPPITCACGCGTPLDRRHYRAAQHRFKDFARGHHVRRHAPPEYGWVSAGLLEKGDFLAYPRLRSNIDASGISAGKAKLLGYFLAEGYYYKQKPHRVNAAHRAALGGSTLASLPAAVTFALNADERDTLAASIQALLLAEFGVESFVSAVPGTNGIYVQSHQSIELVEFFRKYCVSEGACHKRLASDVLQWPSELQLPLVQGYFEGDGCVETTAGGWLCAASASPDLISQVQVILARLGVFAVRSLRVAKGRKRVREANGGVCIVDDPSKSCVAYTLQVGSIHAEHVVVGSFLETAHRLATARRRKHTLSHRITEQALTFPVRSVEQYSYAGPVYNFETEDDHSYVANGVAVHNSDAWERKLLLASFRTFVGGENYLEHLQIPEMSKGKIVDAAARDIGDSIYIDILVATHRKHKPLVAAINAKQLQTLSMGANVAFTLCTKCGNRAADETQLCSHIKYEKGNKFADILGAERRVAELCGHVSEEPGSNKFIEASWVGNPAFPGAVLRNILTREEAAAYDRLHADRIQVAFSTLAEAPLDSRFSKAARKAQFDFGEQSQEFPGGGEQEQAPKEKEPADPLDSVVKDLAKTLTDRAVRRVRQDMDGKAPGNNVQEDHANHTLVPASVNPLRQRLAHAVERLVGDRQSAQRITQGLLLHRAGGWQAVQATSKFSGRDVLAMSRVLDLLRKNPGVAGEARIYRTVLAVGGAASYVDVDSYLAACSQALGREPTQTEKLALLTKGRLFDLGI